MKSLTVFFASSKAYISISLISAYFISNSIDLINSIIMFLIATSLDTLTSIHAGATKKGLKFNPFKLYFWKEIKSGLLRVWLKKVFFEYAIYLIIAFCLDILIIQQQLQNFSIPILQNDIVNFSLNLPVFVLWVLIALEIWSVGENLESTGRINLIKRFAKFLEQYLPEKFKAFFTASKKTEL